MIFYELLASVMSSDSTSMRWLSSRLWGPFQGLSLLDWFLGSFCVALVVPY
jgi:hypothetical protein